MRGSVPGVGRAGEAGVEMESLKSASACISTARCSSLKISTWACNSALSRAAANHLAESASSFKLLSLTSAELRRCSSFASAAAWLSKSVRCTSQRFRKSSTSVAAAVATSESAAQAMLALGACLGKTFDGVDGGGSGNRAALTGRGGL